MRFDLRTLCSHALAPTGAGRHHMMSTGRSEAGFSAEGFRGACLDLVDAYRRAGTESRWTPTSAFGYGKSGYLSIWRDLAISEGRHAALEYHVMFSESWQVPVLYFSPIWEDSQEPLSLKEVYDFIVERNSSDVLQDVGVLGGISHGV